MNWINRLKNLFKVARMISCTDADDIRLGQISFLGKTQRTMIFTPYGLMHNPPEGSMVIAWSQQGQESNSIGIADDPNNRTLKSLAPGEVALGNYETGNYIKFDQNGLCTLIAEDLNVQVTNDITITAENLNVTIGSATTIASGTLEVESDTTMDITAGTTMDLTATGALSVAGATVGITSTGTASISAPAVEHAGVNIGSTHIHSQGNDSDGDTEQDTGVPHS